MSADDRWTLRGKTVLVTGGSQGIGAAVVRELVARSAGRVIFCSRSSPTEEQWAALRQGNNNKPSATETDLHHVACDVAAPEGRAALVEAVRAICGTTPQPPKLDGLVNNVGVNVRRDVTHQSAEEYHTMVRTNMDSAYFLCRQLLPLLEAAAAPAVVTVSSAAGVQSSGTGVAYGMTKAALHQMTRGLACEWAARGVRVNCVAPWMTVTPLLRDAVAGRDASRQLDKAKAWTPLHRLAEAEEVAAPVVFLLLPASSYITGQVLGVDGGLTAQGFEGPCVTGDGES